MLQIAQITDVDLNQSIEAELLELMNDAFEGDLSEEDWQHTYGGIRFMGYLNDELIGHGAVILRSMKVDGDEIKVGYVEAIAIDPRHWRQGYGSRLISEITLYCRSKFSFSMLSTSEKAFYRKYGWMDFEGESYVSQAEVEVRSKEEDEGLMYLFGRNEIARVPRKIVCESRSGDAW